jgi:hypothetical protein
MKSSNYRLALLLAHTALSIFAAAMNFLGPYLSSVFGFPELSIPASPPFLPICQAPIT